MICGFGIRNSQASDKAFRLSVYTKLISYIQKVCGNKFVAIKLAYLEYIWQICLAKLVVTHVSVF